MTCEGCRTALLGDGPKRIAELVDEAGGEKPCGCEAFSVSELSPGLVADDEVLHLLISDPQHLLDGGYINPAVLISIDEDGQSVLRDTASDEEFSITLELLRDGAKGKGRDLYLHGVCAFRAAAIRYKGGERLVCVFDTALEARPHHADIMAPNIQRGSAEALSKTQSKKRKFARIKEVMELIGPSFIQVGDFRGGVFSGFARPQ